MGLEHLFYDDIPSGIKKITINNKTYSIEEFNSLREDFLKKRRKKTKINSYIPLFLSSYINLNKFIRYRSQPIFFKIYIYITAILNCFATI